MAPKNRRIGGNRFLVWLVRLKFRFALQDREKFWHDVLLFLVAAVDFECGGAFFVHAIENEF